MKLKNWMKQIMVWVIVAVITAVVIIYGPSAWEHFSNKLLEKNPTADTQQLESNKPKDVLEKQRTKKTVSENSNEKGKKKEVDENSEEKENGKTVDKDSKEKDGKAVDKDSGEKTKLAIQAWIETELEKTWFAVQIILIVLLPIVLIVLLLFIVKIAAARDFMFTNVREGTAKAVVGAGGKFIKFVYEYSEHYMSPETKWNIIRLSEYKPKESGLKLTKKRLEKLYNNEQKRISLIKNWLGLGGIKYYGIPGLHQINKYVFRWNSLRQTPGGRSQESGGGIYFEPHEEILRYILLQTDVYYARLEKAEDQRMLQLDVDFTISVRVTNPRKAIFRVQEWLEYTWGQILPAVRRAVRHNYNWIDEVEVDEDGNIVDDKNKSDTRKRMARIVWDNINQPVINDSDDSQTPDKKAKKPRSIIDKLSDDFGVTIDDFTMLRIDASGEKAKEFIEIATKVVKAVQEARATRIDFKVEVERLEKVYGKIKDFGNFGEKMRKLEALENSSEHGTVFISAPELSGLAEKVSQIITKP